MTVQTLTALLADNPCSLNPNVILKVLIQVGMAENAEYESTTGTGEIKSFYRLTGDGLNYGKNILSGGHPFKSSPKFYHERFPHLLQLVICHLQHEVDILCAPEETEKPLLGQVVALCGMLETMTRHEAYVLLDKLGAKVAGSISKKVNFIIAGESSEGRKLDQAKEYDIEIWTEEKFIAFVRNVNGIDLKTMTKGIIG